jgi:hypothetical protein
MPVGRLDFKLETLLRRTRISTPTTGSGLRRPVGPLAHRDSATPAPNPTGRCQKGAACYSLRPPPSPAQSSSLRGEVGEGRGVIGSKPTGTLPLRLSKTAPGDSEAAAASEGESQSPATQNPGAHRHTSAKSHRQSHNQAASDRRQHDPAIANLNSPTRAGQARPQSGGPPTVRATTGTSNRAATSTALATRKIPLLSPTVMRLNGRD